MNKIGNNDSALNLSKTASSALPKDKTKIISEKNNLNKSSKLGSKNIDKTRLDQKLKTDLSKAYDVSSLTKAIPDIPISLSSKSESSSNSYEDISKKANQAKVKEEKKEKEKSLNERKVIIEKFEKVHKDKEAKAKIEKPAIIFIGGFDLFDVSSSAPGGMSDMKGHFKGAKFFNWDEKTDIKKEIHKRSEKQPVILVGHSFGADTAVEVANELNNLENKFRNINLLVTIDSVGFNNNIIPENVSKNLNFISEDSFFSGDPNVARDVKRSQVKNELFPHDHRELDDLPQIQREIFENIKQIVPNS